jgi:5,10-methylenetetrahydromethanopterin reductase
VGLEFWRVGQTSPRTIADDAPRSEADGWDGMLIADSQCVIGDSYVGLTIAAANTTRLQLGVGVGNPITRHPSVTASAAAGIQQFSGGRMVLGLGRGDSSLAHIGLAPASPKIFESYLRATQTYLSGGAVPFGDLDRGSHRTSETLGAAGVPEASTLRWLDPSVRKVPVDVAASGPAVIAIAARHADRMTFGVGADPERLRWAIECARGARVEAGLDSSGIGLGAYLNVVAHNDEQTAISLAGSAVAMFSRFSIMHGRTTGPMSEQARGNLTKVREQYDLRDHGRPDAHHAAAVDPAHIRSFGVVGTPAQVVERLVDLHDLGLDRVMILGGLADATGVVGEDLSVSRKLLTSEIIPAVRAALAAR